MTPRPQAEDRSHRGSGKLRDKVALITGGDGGIGRAVAVAFAKSVTAYRGGTPAGLFGHQGGDRRLHALARQGAGGAGGIRVSGVAPGPIWTPLIPATFPADRVASFGADVPMQRAGQPEEVATS